MIAWPTIHCSWQLLREGWMWLFSGPYQPPIKIPPEPEEQPIADLPVVVPALKKLAIGVGPHPLDGWVNVDLAPHSSDVTRLDATGQFPWLNDTFSHVFSEHMIEHVELDGARNMIRECYRVLRPGGRIRIVTPDRDFLSALTKMPLSQLQRDYIAWSCHHFAPEATPSGAVVVEFFQRLWGHQHIFDRTELWAQMCKSGFTDPIMCELRESPDPELCDLENEGRMPPGFLRLESMTIEAVKPQ
jgi:predicted SAM-dependent methyltransferase